MKLLFVHDHKFLERDGSVFSDKLPYKVWMRYLRHFSSVSVFARKSTSSEKKSMPLSSGQGVEFYLEQSIGSASSFLTQRRVQKEKLREVMLNADYVMARLPSEYGLMAISLASKLGKPIAVEVVGCAFDALYYYGGMKAKLYAPFAYIRMRRAVSEASCVLYVSKKFLQRRYPSFAGAVVSAVSNVELSSANEDVLVKRLTRIRDSNKIFRFGLIGSFTARYKGIDTALRALKASGIAKFEFRILGEGNKDYYTGLAKKLDISDSVHFDGVLPSGDAVFGWLDCIDVYLQPSFAEGIPRALIEAMSRGCTAIGSTAGGIPELLDSKFLVGPGDYNALAEIISNIYSDVSELEAQAAINVHNSQEYQKDILDKRRSEYLDKVLRAGGRT